jgi:hypothetical protein
MGAAGSVQWAEVTQATQRPDVGSQLRPGRPLQSAAAAQRRQVPPWHNGRSVVQSRSSLHVPAASGGGPTSRAASGPLT